jgi:Ca2+-binding EF-hand superfamily protein
MTGLGRHFQSLDTTGDGTVDKDELKEALEQFNIQIPAEVTSALIRILRLNSPLS